MQRFVLPVVIVLGCGQPAQAPPAAGSAASAVASASVAAAPFAGSFPQDCEHWPHPEPLKAELIQKAQGFLEGLRGTRSKAVLERIHPAGLLMVQVLPDPEGKKDQKRETLVPRGELLQHLAQGGGAWLLEGFIDPIGALRRPRVGAHWDILDGERKLCVRIDGTEGLFDGKPYVVLHPTEKELDEGQNSQVVVLFDRDGKGTWLAAALVRPYRVVE